METVGRCWPGRLAALLMEARCLGVWGSWSTMPRHCCFPCSRLSCALPVPQTMFPLGSLSPHNTLPTTRVLLRWGQMPPSPFPLPGDCGMQSQPFHELVGCCSSCHLSPLPIYFRLTDTLCSPCCLQNRKKTLCPGTVVHLRNPFCSCSLIPEVLEAYSSFHLHSQSSRIVAGSGYDCGY